MEPSCNRIGIRNMYALRHTIHTTTAAKCSAKNSSKEFVVVHADQIPYKFSRLFF